MFDRNSELSTAYAGCVWILLIIMFFVGPLIGSFVKTDRAMTAMENAGYTDIQVGQRVEWFTTYRGCGFDDIVMFKIDKATAPNGVVVNNAVVCKGIFSGTEIRFRK